MCSNLKLTTIEPLSNYVKGLAKDFWPMELKDFSPWISNHLEIFNDLLGVQLILEQTEANAGKYRTDILAIDRRTGEKVVIENQFGTSNHDHLGKCLTYQAYHQAKTVIWISDRFSTEHLQAIAFLNENTTDEYHYYALSVLVYEIDKKWYFQIVNGVENQTRSSRISSKMSATELQYMGLWEELYSKLDKQPYKDRFQPWGRSYHDVQIDGTKFYLGVSFAKGKAVVYLWTYDKKKKYSETVKKMLETPEFKAFDIPMEYNEGHRNSEWSYWKTPEHDYDMDWVKKNVDQLYLFFKQYLSSANNSNELNTKQ